MKADRVIGRVHCAARAFIARCTTLAAVVGLMMSSVLSSAYAATVQYSYDSLGRLTAAAYDNGTTVTYTYDPAGNLLRKVVAPAGTSSLNINQHGLTGSWYQAVTSGQGVEIEIFPDLVSPGTGFLFGSWFTFDHLVSGGPDRGRWYTFSGNPQTGNTAVALKLFQNVGGNFNALPVTTSVQVGTGTLTFTDCTTATLAYVFSDGSNRSGTVPMTRLTPNVTCAGPGNASSSSADFSFSGNWYDDKTSGQGFLFEVNPVAKVVFFAWYTYAPAGQALGAAGQRWYTGLASYNPGARSIPLDLRETSGGLFNSTTPAPTTAKVGTGTITFSSCTSAKFAFDFTAGSNSGKSGVINLVRVGPVPAGCAL